MLVAQCLKDCEDPQAALAGAACLDGAPRAEFDASIQTAVEDPARQRLYVAGGDQGLWMIDLATDQAQLIDVDPGDTTTPTARWCFDVACPEGTQLVAVFGAEDNSDLRVYTPRFRNPPQMPQL